MTEAEWLGETDPQKLLAFLHEKARERSFRLFACACCRRVWHLLSNGQSRRAVEMVERFIETGAEDEDYRLAVLGAENGAERCLATAATAAEEAQASAAFAAFSVTLAARAAEYTAANAVSAVYHDATAASHPSAAAAREAERHKQVLVLRDLFGNPFRPLGSNPAWLRWNDAAVVRLAQAAYEDRSLPAGTLDNTRLAILADALEEAGCTEEQILTHLRSGGEHYRGCFVLDALLGKG